MFCWLECEHFIFEANNVESWNLGVFLILRLFDYIAIASFSKVRLNYFLFLWFMNLLIGDKINPPHPPEAFILRITVLKNRPTKMLIRIILTTKIELFTFFFLWLRSESHLPRLLGSDVLGRYSMAVCWHSFLELP